jgi:arylsulfatase A-like enzyme
VNAAGRDAGAPRAAAKFARTVLWLVSVLFTLFIATGVDGAEVLKPNVIVILTDDQGTLDAGCYGSTDIATPNIDALAGRGVRFTQFYAAAAVCSPSRAGLLTGRYPRRAGLTGNAGSQRGGAGMPGEQVTMAEMFKAAGYATAHVGKWHLGYQPGMMPNEQGFDHSFGHMGGCIDNYSHFFYWQGPNVHDLHRNGAEVFHDGRFFQDLMVDEAGEFMRRNRAQPFFLYFAINAPHYPYQGSQRWLEHYRDMPHPRRLYAAFLSTMDERIGRLLAEVDSLGLKERTIVVFQSDHGHSMEERAHGGGGSAGPFRGAKFSLFEGGIRVPAILSWPGRIPQGGVREQMSHSCDWLPTLAELCEVPVAPPGLDGKSLAPVLKSAEAASPHRVLHWQMGPDKDPQWAVREGAWKLIRNVQDPTGLPLSDSDKRLFLANLAEDPGERRNYVSEQPEVMERLLKLRTTWEMGKEQ